MLAVLLMLGSFSPIAQAQNCSVYPGGHYSPFAVSREQLDLTRRGGILLDNPMPRDIPFNSGILTIGPSSKPGHVQVSFKPAGGGATVTAENNLDERCPAIDVALGEQPEVMEVYCNRIAPWMHNNDTTFPSTMRMSAQEFYQGITRVNGKKMILADKSAENNLYTDSANQIKLSKLKPVKAWCSGTQCWSSETGAGFTLSQPVILEKSAAPNPIPQAVLASGVNVDSLRLLQHSTVYVAGENIAYNCYNNDKGIAEARISESKQVKPSYNSAPIQKDAPNKNDQANKQ